ncbi:MAG TPA: GspH/FimT family pseudopilin [Candidatus Obscuribacterales bacterium]
MIAGNRVHRPNGFTLIELLVTIAVISITATIAVPNFQKLTARNQLVGDFNQVLSGLNYARSEAVKRREDIAVHVKDASGAVPWQLAVTSGASGSLSTLRLLEGKDSDVNVTEFQVSFNPLGRRGNCIDGDTGDALNCSLSVSYEGEKSLYVEASGNISRP